MKPKLPTRWSACFIICTLVWLNEPVGVTGLDSLNQPQIYVENGHIYFIPAENKNLILKANGRGKIILNSLDLDNLTDSVQNSVKDLNAFKNIFGTSSSSGQITSRIANIEQTMQRLGQIETLDSRLTVVERQLSTNNRSSDSGGGRINTRIRRLQNRIEAVENTLRGAGQNPCSSSPCYNGGTCIPTIYGAFCYCPKGWEGERCDQDVNECANFAGTELGCQNGATCVNRPGTYQCQCQNGYFGIHCTKRSGDCSSGSSWELCGHGVCINQHAGSSPYTCICDAGWKQDGRSPACMTDIDECSQYHTTCSVNPPVSCVNTQGSYVCGPCPSGYSGNGHQCMDVNECAVNNGGCSVNPMVQCTNIVGSRSCGACPPGYMGNGVTCQYVGICHMNNGGCYPLARCVENPMIGQSFVQCICPAGYTGTGMGLHGCIPYQTPSGGGTDITHSFPTGGNPCAPNPCQNSGICHSLGGSSFTCVCMQGFGGPTCSTRTNVCISQPCQNGGTCQPTTTGFTCVCTSLYAGDMCERQVESCGGYLSATEGSLRFPQSQSTYDHNTRCEWLLHTSPGLVLNITFTNFHLEGGTSCSYDYLEIRDGTDSQSPLLGRYCGEELPGGGNIISTHNVLHLTFRSDHNVVGLGFGFNWNSTDPVCGGVLENRTHGSFSSPGYPGTYPHDRDCTWQIKGALGKRLQLVFATFQLETHPNCSYDYVEVRDGLEDSAPVLEKLCNTTVPSPVISSGPYVTVRFHSDDSSSDKGFLITYTEVPGVPGCGGLLSAASGVFSSPQHPQPYAHGLECDWVIRLPSTDDKISVTFINFELEGGFSGCIFDYVEICDGPSLDSPLVGRFCGRNSPPSFESRSNQLFIRFKSDESIALGGFSARYEAVCGGRYSSLSGLLRSPYYPSNYPSLRDCLYVISLPAGNGINLQFLDFDIEPGTDTNCLFDYLEIRDGDNENSTLIGHYCGPPQSAPELITSSFNYLWLRFKTDGSIQNRGFLANYTAFDIGCGGILTDSDGTLTSPGHPEVYPHGDTCMWVIRGKPGEIVRLTWDTFSLESSANCTWDVVEVYDNSTSFVNGSLIGRYCGQDHPPQMTSTDTTLTVIFKSDHSAAYDGFTARFKLLNVSTACGGNYFTEYGVLKSPRYPQMYPIGKSCTWVITAPRGRQIELNVTDFDMEEGTDAGCIYDYLEIRNGPYANSPLIGKFCGNRPPPNNVPSFSNSLFLKFKTDSSHSRRGFNIVWDATSTGCGGILNTPSGSISSPNYPSPYAGGAECVWKIIVNQGNAMQLSFMDIDMQHSGSTNCWGDYVEVLDGVQRNSRSLGKLCSEEHAISVQSADNSVTIKLVISVFGGNGRGFHLNYRTICNRVLKGFQGVIESLNYPNPYPHNRNCTWIIQAGKGNGVNISFSHFDVEAPNGENCTYDYVQISEWKREEIPTNKTILGTYCGVDRPRLVSSKLDTVAVNFVSDHNQASNGFRLEWKQNGCGGHIIGSYRSISSPGYPRRYPNNVECEWKVTTELGTKVQLSIVDLDIEHQDNCLFDGLVVHGGPDETYPILSQLCEKTSSEKIVTSHGNNMFLKFYSDGFLPSKGFHGYVQQVPGGCGGTYRGTSGYIYTPNYPGTYDHNDDCSWLISVDSNHVVELTFQDFDVERHINCTFDHVAIYDGYSEADPLLLTHCGHQLPDPVKVKSTGSYMLVRFKTDAYGAGKGFKAHYELGCGARITAHYGGVITTPIFAGNVLGSRNCSWVLVAPSPDDRISLTFTYLDLSMRVSDTCPYNYVEVLDGEDDEAPSLYRACTGPIPPTLTSRGNALVLNFVGREYHGHGFRVVYDVSSSACGGVLTAANGSIATPNYPNGYAPNIECIWEIRASAGNKVQLSFRRFEIEASEFCNTDFVEIHQDSASGPLLGHYCGVEIPSNITAVQTLWILFRSDGEGQAAGFWADYNLLHGVELSGSSGAVASPMFPNMFSGTGVFTWRIVVNDTFAIQISFDNYEIEPLETPSCQYYNQMKIYDGYDENSPVLLSTCSSEKPDPVISTGNTVYIEYKRLRWVGSFYLRWQQVQASLGVHTSQPNITGCGGNFSLTHGNATTLTSPGFPNRHLSKINCEWTFDAPPNSRIRLNVETLALRNSNGCLNNRVELYDGVRGLPNYELNKTTCYEDPRNSTSYLSSGRFLKVVFKSDGRYSHTGFNFTLKTECGGYVRDSRGTISSPNYPNNYVESNCVWNVVVRPGRTIRLTFNSNFDIYSASGQCATDQLILRNGANEESPFLGNGRYCGSTPPTNLETSGNHLFVHFTSWTHGGKGFVLTFEEVSLGCSGNIQLTNNAPSTFIQSPNFPQIPPPHTECEWVFSAPQGEAVQLTFQVSFDFAESSESECQNAGVELHDGGTPLSRSLGVFCRDMPGTLKSTGNVLYVRYYTNVAEPRSGFKAEVSIATCGGVHTGGWGTISSPGFPATYEPNMDCVWTIKAQRGYSLILMFEIFNMGSGDANCTKDKIIITEQNLPDGVTDYDMRTPYMSSLRNWTLCGRSDGILPDIIQTGSNEAQIHFTSDGIRERNATGMGFKLHYSARSNYCGGTLRTPTGIIQSPQPFPAYFLYCHWKIYAPEGRRIRIEFTEFNLHERYSLPNDESNKRDCYSDQITIYQSDRSTRSPLYNQSLCGSALPPPVETTFSQAIIFFKTSGSTTNGRFKLRYTTDLPVLCGGLLDFTEGNITSPNATTNTPNTTTNMFCEWKTASGNGTSIVTINSLRIPSSGVKDSWCVHGFLNVFMPNSYRYMRDNLCGSYTNEKLYFPGGPFQVDYVADDLNSTFSLSYKNMPCGGTVLGPQENITSINYPSAYPINTECIWVVQFGWGTQIKINFLDLDLDDHQGTDGCDNDYVLIRNGQHQTSPVLGKYCGTYFPSSGINSMSNGLWVEFHSDGSSDGSRRGFKLQLEESSNSCGGILHSKIGQVVSPKLDNRRYPHSTECEWVIETLPGFVINIVFFNRFDIENSTNCTNDYVGVFKKSGLYWILLGKFCGRQLPQPINSTSMSVKIVFKSNENLNGDGFSLYWYSQCGGLFQGSTGVIRSAHYDTISSGRSNPGRFYSWQTYDRIYTVQKCDYVVQGNPSDYIMVRFLDPFEVQAKASYGASESDLSVQCPVVNVTVREGNSTQQTRPFSVFSTQQQTRHFCGRETPPPFIGRGTVVISYNYMGYYENYGFRAQYDKFDCGGEVTTPRTIKSPGHPFRSASNMNCTWIARAPRDKVVRFRFEFLETEFHRSCIYDYVRLYDGPLADNKLIGSYCGNLTTDLPNISSKSSIMTVMFVTDSVLEHRGFEATIDFTVGENLGCGGTRNLTAGPVTLTSVDTDGNGKYEDDLDCQWLIIAPQFKSVEISFSAFNLEGSQGLGKSDVEETCSFDYVEIRDGPGPHGQLLAKLCGNVIPSPIISSLNFIWVRFVTDGSVNLSGFTLTARSRESPCGQLVFTANNSIQYLTSPGYPAKYENNVRCRWRINGARWNDEVDITFIDLDIESSQDCGKDRLEISDASSSYITPEGLTGPTLFTANRVTDWRFRHLNLTMSTILQDYKYCGSQTPPDFYTVGRSAEIVFHTDGDSTRKGFKIAYKAAGCNRTYESTQGRIFSPEWPTHTPIFSNCLSSIRAPNGSYIALYFNSFNLPGSSTESTCTEAALEIRDRTPSGQLLAQYCGSSIPDPVFSTSNVLYVKFFSRIHPAIGFDITYTTTDRGRGCGGDIFHTGGSFTSPMYPGNHSLNIDCIWRVRVPGGLRVQITFTNFMFTGNCQTDFVEISSLESHDITSTPVLYSRYCSGDVPSVYTGNTDMAVVRYKTSVNNTGSGWRAIFKGVFPTSI